MTGTVVATPGEFMVEVGNRLRDLRKDAGMSLAKAEEVWGIPAVVIGSYERADRSMNLQMLFRIATAAGVDPASLLPSTGDGIAVVREVETAVLRHLLDRAERKRV